jgi:hypothetical protein
MCCTATMAVPSPKLKRAALAQFAIARVTSIKDGCSFVMFLL